MPSVEPVQVSVYCELAKLISSAERLNGFKEETSSYHEHIVEGNNALQIINEGFSKPVPNFSGFHV